MQEWKYYFKLTYYRLIQKFSNKKALPLYKFLWLGWLKYPNVAPIPGSKNKERIIENINTYNIYKVKFTNEKLNKF